jgi:hypothetical protein
MTYILDQNNYTDSASDYRYEFSFSSQNVAITDIFDLTTYNSKNVLTNISNSKFNYFSYANANATSSIKIANNTLGFDFEPDNITAGFYHVHQTICFARYNTGTGDSKIIVNPVEVGDRYSYFAGTESSDPESVPHSRFLFHGNSAKRSPTTSYSSIDYFKFKSTINTNDERESQANKYKSFSQLNLEYTLESNSTDNFLPTLYFYLEDQNANSINTDKLSIYSTSFTITKFDSTNQDVIDLFA